MHIASNCWKSAKEKKKSSWCVCKKTYIVTSAKSTAYLKKCSILYIVTVAMVITLYSKVISYENLWKLLVGGTLLTLSGSGFVFPMIHILVAPSVVSPGQSERWSVLLRGTQRKRRCGEVQEIAHSKDKHSLLFSHTFHRAMIMEQILPDTGQWISAMGFQIGDVWGRVSRVQCTWPSNRVVSSAFLPSALQAVKPRAKQTQKQIVSEYDFTSAVGTYPVVFLW